MPGMCQLCHERYGKGMHFCNGGDSCPSAVPQLRADLATLQEARALDLEAIATVAAERDTWKSLAKDNMRQLLRDVLLTLSSDALEAERAAHAETRKALEGANKDIEEHLTELVHRGELIDKLMADDESTRAELVKAEERVKAALNYYDGQGSVCDHMREMGRLLRG